MRRSPHLMGPSMDSSLYEHGVQFFHLDVVAVDSTWNVVIESDRRATKADRRRRHNDKIRHDMERKTSKVDDEDMGFTPSFSS